MITFILNNEKISTGKPAGSSLLDFIRYEMGLTGTKTGCREGDCGACTVLVGTAEGGKVNYKSVVSCLTPLAMPTESILLPWKGSIPAICRTSRRPWWTMGPSSAGSAHPG